MIVTLSKEEGQVPFEIVQRKTFAPTDKPVTDDVAEEGTAIVPVPEINVQAPLPMAGIFPAKTDDEEQTV